MPRDGPRRRVSGPVPDPRPGPPARDGRERRRRVRALRIIGPGGRPGSARSWRGWVVGSSARVRPLGRLTINGWRVRAVYVPQAGDEGSAFAHHVVLIWTVGRHTYGAGFHDVRGIRAALALDRELVRSIRLVSGTG
jgi:hypothetical protein